MSKTELIILFLNVDLVWINVDTQTEEKKGLCFILTNYKVFGIFKICLNLLLAIYYYLGTLCCVNSFQIYFIFKGQSLKSRKKSENCSFNTKS